MRFQKFSFKDLNEARRFVISIRSNLSPRFIKLMSQKAQEEITRTPEFQTSQNIACFVSSKGEPDTSVLISSQNKNIFLPKVLGDGKIGLFLYRGKLVEGSFGIPEPDSIEEAEPEQIELFVVPGVLFDSRGFRVGYGKGYYDRVLARRSASTPIFAMSWSFQVFDMIPYERPTDVFVHRIFTEIYVLDVTSGSVRRYF